jgi:alcohol dehydrogenase
VIPFRSPVPRFIPSGDIFVGDGALSAVRALAGVRVAVVTTATVAHNPLLREQLERAIAAPTISHHLWQGGEPALEGVQQLAEALREQRPDVIVAIGGGSVIDAARGAWLLYEHPSLDLTLSARRVAVPPLRGLARFAALPTTAGAGAEVSSAIVLTDVDGRKLILVSGEFLPDLVVLDPRLAAAVPLHVLRQGVCDVLAHVVEGQCSRVANSFVGLLGQQMFPSVWLAFQDLAEREEEPTTEQRLHLMQLALQGGWVQNHRPPGLGHAVAHTLSRLKVPHAVAAGLCLAPALRENMGHAATHEALSALATSVGLSDADALVAGIDSGVRRIVAGLPSLQPAIRAQQSDLIETALQDITARMNPIPLNGGMVQRVLEAIP